MDISTVISVALGMVFLFLVVSVITSAIAEAISTVLRTRPKHLKRAIVGMLGETEADELYGTEIIESLKNRHAFSLGRKETSDPSYISGRDFTNALLAVLDVGQKMEDLQMAGEGPGTEEPTSTTLGPIRDLVDGLPNGKVKSYLEDLISAGTASLESVGADLTLWFDSVMDRASGWYKRWVNVVIFVAGLALAAAFNINALVVADSLWSDPVLRASVESAVSQRIATEEPSLGPTAEDVLEELRTLDALNIPFGWTAEPDDSRHFGALSLPGWILTALAATAGAPFWFDLLKRVANVRGSGPPSGKKGEPAT